MFGLVDIEKILERRRVRPGASQSCPLFQTSLLSWRHCTSCHQVLAALVIGLASTETGCFPLGNTLSVTVIEGSSWLALEKGAATLVILNLLENKIF